MIYLGHISQILIKMNQRNALTPATRLSQILLPHLLFGLCLQFGSTTVSAKSFEGDELAAYDRYCPAGNYRAVWAELLTRHLEGWVNLVCLNEDLQETSFFYITPDGAVQSAESTVLPVYTAPFVAPGLEEEILSYPATMNIVLLLDFKYEEPDLSLEQFGAPADVGGGVSSSVGGSNDPVVVEYSLNGEVVSQQEYEAWEAVFNQANRDMSAERDRLVEQQAHVALYDLIDRNQWHDSFDVAAINSGLSQQVYWIFPASLIIELTGSQARELLVTGPDYLTRIDPYSNTEPSNDGGPAIVLEPTTGTGEEQISEIPIATVDELIPLEDASTSAVSSAGSGSWFWLTLLPGFLVFRQMNS